MLDRSMTNNSANMATLLEKFCNQFWIKKGPPFKLLKTMIKSDKLEGENIDKFGNCILLAKVLSSNIIIRGVVIVKSCHLPI